MRLAQVGLGSGVGLTGFDRKTAHFWSGPRPILSLPEMPDNYRKPVIPRRDYKTVDKKTPLRQPTREE